GSARDPSQLPSSASPIRVPSATRVGASPTTELMPRTNAEPPTAGDQLAGTRADASAAITYPASINAGPTTQPWDQATMSKTISTGRRHAQAVTRRQTELLSRIDANPATSATVNAGQAWTRRPMSPASTWSAAPWAPIDTAA